MANGVYNPYMQEPVQPQYQQPTGQRNGFIPISGGEEAALNYALGSNATVMFISGDTSEMFMRGTDVNGMTNSFRAFDIKEKMTDYQRNLMGDGMTEYASKADVTALAEEISELKKFLEELTSPAKG